MSSPLGHSLVGYLIAKQVFGRKQSDHRKIFLCVVVSNVPDLDLSVGAMVGAPNLYHHGLSHSIGAAVTVAVIMSIACSKMLNMGMRRCFLLLLGLYSVHLVLDYLSTDGRPPYGIPLFWPLSKKSFIAPWPVLIGVAHSNLDHATVGQFIEGVLSVHNLYVITLEIAVAILISAFIPLCTYLFKRVWLF